MVSLRLRSKHWIVDENDNMIMGAGRMEILETIAKTGSINQTAKIMKMRDPHIGVSKITGFQPICQVAVVTCEQYFKALLRQDLCLTRSNHRLS